MTHHESGGEWPVTPGTDASHDPYHIGTCRSTLDVIGPVPDSES